MPFLALALGILILAGIASYLTRRRAPLGNGAAEATFSGPREQPFEPVHAGPGGGGPPSSASALDSANSNPDPGFATSVLVADATHNVGLAYMAGGSILGAVLGYELAEQSGHATAPAAFGGDAAPADTGPTGHAGADPAFSADVPHFDPPAPDADHAGNGTGDLHSFTP